METKTSTNIRKFQSKLRRNYDICSKYNTNLGQTLWKYCACPHQHHVFRRFSAEVQAVVLKNAPPADLSNKWQNENELDIQYLSENLGECLGMCCVMFNSLSVGSSTNITDQGHLQSRSGSCSGLEKRIQAGRCNSVETMFLLQCAQT